MRLSPLVLAALLVGCMPVSSIPPASRIDVESAYADAVFDDASLAVVVAEVEVTDGGVAAHVGGGADADAAYRAFFAEQVPLAFQTARLGEARVVGAPVDVSFSGLRPDDGERLRFEDMEPDFVLLLDTLHVDRARYFTETMHPTGPNGMMQTQRSESQALRIDTNVVLWDNRAGAEVASGRLEAERKLPPIGRSRAHYADAVREFVEQLARFTPLSLRE